MNPTTTQSHQRPTSLPTFSRRRSRGFALILVLISVGVAMTLALGFVSTQSTAIGVMRNIEDHTQARYIAESGLEMTNYYIRTDLNWRTDQVEGEWITDHAYGNGTFSITATDGDQAGGDGDLADDLSDTLYLTAIGKFGAATHTVNALITPTSAPASGLLLMVVPNVSSLSTNDTSKVKALRKLNWNVTLIDDDTTAEAFAIATAEQDVLYVSQTATAAGLGAKFKTLTIGMVSENDQVSIDLQMASSFANFSSTDLEIYDNTHYITQPFFIEDLSVFFGNTPLHKAEVSDLAPGARVLGLHPTKTDAAVFAIDIGSRLVDDSTASSRRVHVPWSRSDTNFEGLTASGLTLLERTLKWVSVSSFLAESERGIIAMGTVKVKNTGYIDSFDSSKGAYGGDNIDTMAIITTNSSTPGDITISDSGMVKGFVLADPPSIINGSVPTQISGSKIQLAKDAVMPTVMDPASTLPPSEGDKILSGNVTWSSDHHFAALTFNPGTVVTVDQDITVLCDGEWRLQDATLKINPGVTLSVYLKNKYKAKGASQVNVYGADPRRLRIYQLVDTHIDFEDTSHTYATITSPLGLLHVKKNSHFYGTFIGDRVEVKDNGQLHQDTFDASASLHAPIVEYEFNEPPATEPVLIHHWPLGEAAAGISVSGMVEVKSSSRIAAISGTIYIQTNSTKKNQIVVKDSAVISNTYIEVGVGGSPNSVISIEGSAEINGKDSSNKLTNVGALEESIPIPSFQTPTVTNSKGNLSRSSGTITISSDTKYNSISLDSDATIKIVGHVTIVCKGELSMNGNSQITIEPGSSLKLYALDKIKLDSNARLNSDTSKPWLLTLFHPGTESIEFKSDSVASVNAYYPNGDLKINDSSNFYGSFNGKNLFADGASTYHGSNSTAESPTPGKAINLVGNPTGKYQGVPTGNHEGHSATTLANLFDGIDDCIVVDHENSMLLDSGTLSIWFNADDLKGDHYLFSKDATSYGNGGHIKLYTSGSRLTAQLHSTNAAYTIQSSNGLNTGQWHHAVVSWGHRGFKLYLDGVLVDSDKYTGGFDESSGGTGNTEPLVFGGNSENSTTGNATPLADHFEGFLSDIKFYDNPLGDNQVEDLFNNLELSANTDPGIEVVDTSGFGSPLDLIIQDPSEVSWIEGGGLIIQNETRIISTKPATKIYDALTATNRMTVEVIFTPANLSQSGAARIATYGESLGSENFIVGQKKETYVGRVRTSNTGSNGLPNVESTDVLTTIGRHHLVFTYDETDVKIYRDGALEMIVPRTGTFASWDPSVFLSLVNDANESHPWLGTLYRIAVYDETLEGHQLEDLFIGVPPELFESEDTGFGYDARWIENP